MVVDGKVDLDLKTTADETREYANGKEDGEISIVIEADREIVRS